jgi:hypothetical protein
MKLIIHLQLMPRSRKLGYIYPLPHTSSWRSASLVKHMYNFTLQGAGIHHFSISLMAEMDIPAL